MMLEIHMSTILLVQPFLAIGEASRNAAFAFRTVGTVEEGDVLVADVLEPIILYVSF